MDHSNSSNQINATVMKRGASKHQQRYSHKAPTIGPYSRSHHLFKVDGRTREAQLMHRVRKELTKQVGPNPTTTQRMLIDRAVILSLRIAQLDRKIVADQHFTILDNN